MSNDISLQPTEAPSRGPFAYFTRATQIWTSGVVLFGMVLSGPILSSANDQPHELPKPELKTTPPVFEEWNFETGSSVGVPEGFQIFNGGQVSGKGWNISEDSTAPSRSHVVQQSLVCEQEDCYQLLVSDNIQVDYVDISVRLKMLLGSPSGYAGLAFSIQDAKNFYAAVVHPKNNHVVVYAVKEGKPMELGKADLILNDTPWHTLRVQRYTIISKEVIEVFFDQHMLLSLWDGSFRVGKLGLVAMGKAGFAFDNLRVMELLTQRPFSRPSAY
ncbi:MAG: hypothetical protein AB7P17_07850 [Nitrospirales bacterium]|nr:hypothetical protein [Nitrospirales bacterium]